MRNLIRRKKIFFSTKKPEIKLGFLLFFFRKGRDKQFSSSIKQIIRYVLEKLPKISTYLARYITIFHKFIKEQCLFPLLI